MNVSPLQIMGRQLAAKTQENHSDSWALGVDSSGACGHTVLAANFAKGGYEPFPEDLEGHCVGQSHPLPNHIHQEPKNLC